MRRSFVIFAIATIFLPTVGSAQTATAKKSAVGDRATMAGMGSAGWHGAVEMRHHLVTYYDEAGHATRQEPTGHVRMQLGLQLYDGMVDLYATVGAYKRTQTLQVLQRRPELTLDLRPMRSEYFELLQYSLVKLPFQQEDPDPEAQEQEISEGSIFVVGLAPSVKLPIDGGSTRYNIVFGVEGWTKFYSRKQYTTEDERTGFDEVDDGRLGLTDNQEDPESFEDFAPHYDVQSALGFQVVPMVVMPGLKMDLNGHYHSSFRPAYTRYESGVDHKYNVQRYSYFTGKAEYALSPRISLINEFSAYYDKFFQDQRVGDNRRYRNVTRLLCRL